MFNFKTKKMGRQKGTATSIEGWVMLNGKPGDEFLTTSLDKTVTSQANYYKRKISTERMLIVSSAKKEPTASYVLKVTILE